jgi:hypothetical protein
MVTNTSWSSTWDNDLAFGRDYVDTLASHSTDTAPPASQESQQPYTQTSSYDVSKKYIHFALRNTGACSSILSVKVSQLNQHTVHHPLIQ